MNAELISTGAELLNGSTVNGHAAVLGAALRPLGVRLLRDTTLPDDLEAIAGAVRDALARVDVVFVSGGLGPTPDDLTREAIAQALGRGVVTDPVAMEHLAARYHIWGRRMTAASERQALVVEGAVVLPNPVGAAAGERIDVGDRSIFVLPGPPNEFRAVLDTHILPFLAEQMPVPPSAGEAVFMTCGLGESDMVTLFEREGFPEPGIGLAFCAAPGRLEVRLDSADGSGAAMARAVDALRRLIGPHLFAEERIELEALVLRMLDERGARLAVLEAGTGGLLLRLLAAGRATTAFAGGCLAPDHETLVRRFGIEPDLLEREGACSEAVATRLAEAVRLEFDADYGLSLTAPGGPGRERAWAALHGGGDSAAVRLPRSGGDEPGEIRAARLALDFVRRTLSARIPAS